MVHLPGSEAAVGGPGGFRQKGLSARCQSGHIHRSAPGSGEGIQLIRGMNAVSGGRIRILPLLRSQLPAFRSHFRRKAAPGFFALQIPGKNDPGLYPADAGGEKLFGAFLRPLFDHVFILVYIIVGKGAYQRGGMQPHLPQGVDGFVKLLPGAHMGKDHGNGKIQPLCAIGQQGAEILQHTVRLPADQQYISLCLGGGIIAGQAFVYGAVKDPQGGKAVALRSGLQLCLNTAGSQGIAFVQGCGGQFPGSNLLPGGILFYKRQRSGTGIPHGIESWGGHLRQGEDDVFPLGDVYPAEHPLIRQPGCLRILGHGVGAGVGSFFCMGCRAVQAQTCQHQQAHSPGHPFSAHIS